MPIYVYKHPKTEEIKEVIQSMSEKHVYIDADNVEWQRVFLIPKTQIDSQIDPCSSNDFSEKTSKKRMTLGDMWDKSKELSEARIKKFGRDPVKEKTCEEYKRKTKKDHPLATS